MKQLAIAELPEGYNDERRRTGNNCLAIVSEGDVLGLNHLDTVLITASDESAYAMVFVGSEVPKGMIAISDAIRDEKGLKVGSMVTVEKKALPEAIEVVVLNEGLPQFAENDVRRSLMFRPVCVGMPAVIRTEFRGFQTDVLVVDVDPKPNCIVTYSAKVKIVSN